MRSTCLMAVSFFSSATLHIFQSGRMKHLLEKRPLFVDVERGPPVHVTLLPPRSALDPLAEAKIARKGEKEQLAKARKAEKKAEQGNGNRRQSLGLQQGSVQSNGLGGGGGGDGGSSGGPRRGSIMSSISFKMTGVGSQKSVASGGSGSIGGIGGSDARPGMSGFARQRSSMSMHSSAASAELSYQSLPGMKSVNDKNKGKDNEKQPPERENSYEGIVTLVVSCAAPTLGIGIRDGLGGVTVANVNEGSEGERLGIRTDDKVVGIGTRRFDRTKTM